MMDELNYYGLADLCSADHYQAAIYCRLSKDDELDGESASIANQKSMLEDFCSRQGWNVVGIYQDDGYTGLNMDRPDFQRLLSDVEKKRINLIVTKDLSQLGRNYLQTGNLIEDFFPRHGVRYIAMNDGIDTMMDNNDFAPFKNILNEMYSRDISKKVHSSYLLKARQGQFTGNLAPFGYKKDPDVKGHLLIDEDTAPIVRKIFGYALQGHGPNYILRRLEQEKIPCPAWWNRQKGLRSTLTKWEVQDPENGKYVWDFSAIKDMLQNPVYYGAIASQKKLYRFKIGVISEKKPEDWIIIEGQHEPIIDHENFEAIQNNVSCRQRSCRNGEPSIFAGLLRCGECGKALTIHYTHAVNPQQYFTCKTYNSYGKEHCTQHRIDFDTLYALVLGQIQECARDALRDRKAAAEKLRGICERQLNMEREELERSLARNKERLEILEKMVLRLYEDMIAGRINEENFNDMLKRTQAEQDDLKRKITGTQEALPWKVPAESETGPGKWLDALQKYAGIERLDSAILHRLIRKIVVHEEIDENKIRHISVEIHFNLMPISSPEHKI